MAQRLPEMTRPQPTGPSLDIEHSSVKLLERLFALDSKVALVTGGGKGIGRVAALTLAEAGAHVAVVARSESDLAEVADGVRAFGRHALAIAADLADPSQLDPLIAAVVGEFGRLDILVNNVGVNRRNQLVDITDEDWHYMVSVNLRAMFGLSRAAVHHMIDRGEGGKIINVTSVGSVRGNPKSSLYCLAKGGIQQFTRAIASELARAGHNIQVNCIAPGTFETPMIKAFNEQNYAGSRESFSQFVESRVPMGRMGRPEEMQAALLLLAGRGSSYITGESIFVDGGWAGSL